MFVRIRAAGPIGIYDGQGVRDGGVVGEVMVGDDEVEAEDAGFSGFSYGTDACVDADDEANACGCSS